MICFFLKMLKKTTETLFCLYIFTPKTNNNNNNNNDLLVVAWVCRLATPPRPQSAKKKKILTSIFIRNTVACRTVFVELIAVTICRTYNWTAIVILHCKVTDASYRWQNCVITQTIESQASGD